MKRRGEIISQTTENNFTSFEISKTIFGSGSIQ